MPPSAAALLSKKCVPCEGGVPTIEHDEATTYLSATPEWTLANDSKSISRKVGCKNFVEALAWANQIGELAEDEGHHPDLHLTGYRNLRVVLTTHAIGCLSENEFILAAKIDAILT